MHSLASPGPTPVAPARHAGAAVDQALPPDVRLRCPRCGTGIDELACPTCGFAIAVRDGIAHALPAESLDRHAKFMESYQRIREAEGRGSHDDAFYLDLPYRDRSGRDRRQWRIRARSYDYLVRHLLAGTGCPRSGRLLDLGAGNCWMSYRLALAGYRPCAVDLLTNDRDGLGAARHYRPRLPALFPRVQADIGRLPFADGQFDAAVFNASFHYSEDGEASLCEALRCVKPGGIVIISDTPWYPSARDGRRMVAERQATFRRCYGTAAGPTAMLQFLTDDWLRTTEQALPIRWEIHHPWYGLAWAMRPVVARLRGRRGPSRFRLYAARKPA